MDLTAFKLDTLGIDRQQYDKIFTFVDFGNINYWFERDERDGDSNILGKGRKLVIDINKLAGFANLFSEKKRFYFGLDNDNQKSISIISKARGCFDYTGSKPIQWIKHYMTVNEAKANTRSVNEDLRGQYTYLPKCNFDVEICVDTVKLLDYYDTFCLWSSDSDFAYLLEYLRKKKKKIILFSSGYVSHSLKDKANVNINGQQIKKYVTRIIEKPRL